MFLRLATETGKKARVRGGLMIVGGFLLAFFAPPSLVTWVGLGIYTIGNFAYASAKGYEGWVWAIASLLIIGPIVLFLLPDKSGNVT